MSLERGLTQKERIKADSNDSNKVLYGFITQRTYGCNPQNIL